MHFFFRQAQTSLVVVVHHVLLFRSDKFDGMFSTAFFRGSGLHFHPEADAIKRGCNWITEGSAVPAGAFVCRA